MAGFDAINDNLIMVYFVWLPCPMPLETVSGCSI